MRRRNKPRVVWIPVTNANSTDGLSTGRSAIQFQSFQCVSDTPGSTAVLEIPCVLDGSNNQPLDPASSLADIESSGYRLRRIVGEIYIDCVQNVLATGEGGALFQVTAGFIIRRTDPITGASLASQATTTQALALDDIENGMDPWIWRRSWRMGNSQVFAAGSALTDETFRSAPHDNYTRGNGSLYTGPHVDQKTARIVGPEERLFLGVQASLMLPDTAGAVPVTFLVASSLRVLGSMRTNIGNRRNASR